MRRSLPVVLLVAFPSLAGSGVMAVSAQGAGPGSMVPCRAPLSWTIATVDPRFGITGEEALAAARQAGRLWEEAVGAELFDFGSSETSAYPIAFEYDDRQATLDARGRRRADLDSTRRDIEERRRALEAESRRFDAARGEFERDSDAHNRAMTAYNAVVAAWNRRGGAPDDVRADLEAKLSELRRAQGGLRVREDQLGRLSERLGAEVQALNGRIADLQRREDRFVSESSMMASESGRYDETVMWEGDRVRSVARRIRVFQFSDPANLVLVLAHELGHALGLGHAEGPGAVMSETIQVGEGTDLRLAATQVDALMLADLCPGLRGGGAVSQSQGMSPSHGSFSAVPLAPRRPPFVSASSGRL